MVKKQLPTLEMVAERAGVSRATVSRVVNGHPRVTPQVAEHVREAIEALNYVPNRAARSLASQRTQSVALVVPESAAKVFTDPFFASVVQGVVTRIADSEYTLTLIIESESNASKTRRYLTAGNVDGALIVSHHLGDHSYSELSQALPVVFGGRPLGGETDTVSVDVDNLDGARKAVEYLISRERTRIATIAGPQDMPPGVDRLLGWRQVIDEAGLSPGPVAYGDFSTPSGTRAMKQLLESGEPIDALFAANDQMAIGALAAMREAGLVAPDDIAVIGYDDSVFSDTADPSLTTIRQPMVAMGEEMASKLLRLIDGLSVEPVTMLRTSLVVRDSA